jgi:hypothetical protein
MKKLFVFICVMFSLNALAFMPEVECEYRQNGKIIFIEIEQPFPNSSHFRKAKTTLVVENKETVDESTVTARMPRGFKEINYVGSGLNMTVDLWPDSIPRWGRTYRATVHSSAILGNERIRDIECRFPFAQ